MTAKAELSEATAEPEVALSVVVPLYNEAECVGELHRRVRQAIEPLDLTFELVLTDDGSTDGTPTLLDDLARADHRVTVIHLSRNFGHQPALCAAIDQARGRAVIALDGDLQDPPELIPALVARWREGFEVVYAIRQGRKEGPLKRLGYFTFYRLLRAVSELDIPVDSGDFCLMDRRVVDVLKHLPERMRFVRGLRSFAGFRQVGVAYERDARAAGKPKYGLGALMMLAIDGLISFSGYPLRLVVYLGMLTIGVALVLLCWVLGDALYNRTAPQGWASTMVTVLFMGSIQLCCLGIIGEYLRLIFLETKGRPTYIIRELRRGTDP